MTDQNLPVCVCSSESSQPEYGNDSHYYVECENESCVLYGIEMTMEKWRQLHTPAQVLREICALITEADEQAYGSMELCRDELAMDFNAWKRIKDKAREATEGKRE